MSRPYRSAPQPAEFRVARERHGLTIAQAAAMFSVTPKTWRNWEGGDHTGDGWYLVTLDFAVARARTLGILPALDPRAAASAVPCRAPEELAALIGRALHDLEHGWTAAAADVLHRAAQLVDELRKAAL